MQNEQNSGSAEVPKNLIVLWWFLFWALNGMDKFINGQNLVLFRWYGKDRALQFG